jgi:hypothetical protein
MSRWFAAPAGSDDNPGADVTTVNQSRNRGATDCLA